jgi:hypothetical protein
MQSAHRISRRWVESLAQIAAPHAFSHDKFHILGESPGDGGHRVIATELTRGTNTRTPRFYVIQGPSNRYYIDNMEIAAVRDFCRGEGR